MKLRSYYHEGISRDKPKMEVFQLHLFTDTMLPQHLKRNALDLYLLS